MAAEIAKIYIFVIYIVFFFKISSILLNMSNPYKVAMYSQVTCYFTFYCIIIGHFEGYGVFCVLMK